MSTMLLRRLGKEIKEVKTDRQSGIFLEPISDGNEDHDGTIENLKHFMGVFAGPPDTPYEGGRYHVDIKIPDRYPFEPPIIKFTTKIWHPNISSQTGVICLDTLGKAWSPILTLKTCLISVQSLLVSPEPSDPQDAQVANMLMHDPDRFRDTAKDWAILYAGAPGNKQHISTTTSSDEVTEQSAQEFARRLEAKQRQTSVGSTQYKGYNRRMIQPFVAMGFPVTAVVTAFQRFGIDTCGGEYYDLEEEYIGDVTAHLCGEVHD